MRATDAAYCFLTIRCVVTAGFEADVQTDDEGFSILTIQRTLFFSEAWTPLP